MDSEENQMSDLEPSKHSHTPTGKGQKYQDDTSPESTNYRDEEKRSPAMQIQSSKSPSRRLKRRKSLLNEGLLAVMCKWIISHQIGLAANMILLHAMTHICFPRARQSTRKFHLLSYYNPSTGRYALGWDDFYMVCYSIIVLTGLRASVMDYVLVPLAQMAGAKTKKGKVRISEQGWVLIYDTTMFSLGMYIMYTHEHWFNMRQLWTGWPDRELEGSMKWYYLVQFAFWVQQILVVNIEERRKDYWQMFAHHIITCILMFSSYGYHQTKVGNVILVLMDVVDVLLAFAKILNYLQFQVACDIAFGVFMIGWVVARHIIYLRVVYSLYADTQIEIAYGCYAGSNSNLSGPVDIDIWAHLTDPFRDPAGTVCWNGNILMMFVVTLLSLQVILCVWFAMITRVAIKVIRGGGVVDSRSDDEDAGDSEDEGEQVHEKQSYQQALELPPLEEEVGVEGINLSNQRHTPSRKFRKSGGVASGVTLNSDRKELLGRVGCDKMSD